MTTQLLESPTRQNTDQGDLVAHYADKSKITEALVFGGEVTALCGYVWTPTRDPEGRPVCQRCKEIYESLPL